MKHALLAFLVLVTGCSKSTDFTANTAVDKTNPYKKNNLATLVYTYTYVGSSDASFSAVFPPFGVYGTTLKSWTLDIHRKVSGTITLTNMLNTRNDSAINVNRTTIVNVSDNAVDSTLAILPDSIVQRIKNKLDPNAQVTIPVNFDVNDEISSTQGYILNTYPIQTGFITFGFSDLIALFKPNCINSFNLTDSTIVTYTYTYPQPLTQ
ncbi:MAG: hypothetical protein Q8941_22780 [Bacteroidota bacterium]|nr:hypothetical protein [Bacteroidota bacterium]